MRTCAPRSTSSTPACQTVGAGGLIGVMKSGGVTAGLRCFSEGRGGCGPQAQAALRPAPRRLKPAGPLASLPLPATLRSSHLRCLIHLPPLPARH